MQVAAVEMNGRRKKSGDAGKPRDKVVKVAGESKWRLDVIAAAEGLTMAALVADMAAIRYRRLLDAGWLAGDPRPTTMREMRQSEGLPPEAAPLPGNRNERKSVHVSEDTKTKLDIIAAVEGLGLAELLHDMATNRYAMMLKSGRLPDRGDVSPHYGR